MKKLVINIALTLTSLCCFAQTTTISQYPNISTAPSSFLLLWAQPGVTNWNQSLAQFEIQLYIDLPFIKTTWNFDSAKFVVNGTNVNLAASSVDFTNLTPMVTNWVHTTTTNVATTIATDLAATAQTNAVSYSLRAATNTFVLTGMNITNGFTIWLSTTNYNIANSNFIYIAAVTNAQGKLYVSSNNVWFTK